MSAVSSASGPPKRPSLYSKPGGVSSSNKSAGIVCPEPVAQSRAGPTVTSAGIGSATTVPTLPPKESVPVNGLVQLARQSFSQKDFFAALQYLTRALVIAPKDINILDSRAASFEKLGRLDDALTDAKTMIKINPQNPKGYLRAGKILRLQQNIKSSARVYIAGTERSVKGTKDYEKEARVLDPIERLPLELLMIIFGNLNFTERIRCLEISKKWMTYLGSVRHFWYSIDLARRVPSSIRIQNHSLYLPTLPDHDTNNRVTNRTVINLVKYTPPKALRLGCAQQITGALFTQMTKMRRTGALEVLSLRMNSRVYAQEFPVLWSATPKLRSLDLHECLGVTDTVVVAVLERCPLLEELDISECRITEACVMINSTVPLPNMKKLVIGHWGTQFAKEGVDELVARFPNLNTLDIRTMRPRGIEALENICQLKHLKHLYTDSVETSGDVATSLVVQRWVEGIPNLESLRLNACYSSVSDRLLLDIKTHCPKVEMVQLANSGQVTGIGLMALVNERGRGLERICVDDCPALSADAVDRARMALMHSSSTSSDDSNSHKNTAELVNTSVHIMDGQAVTRTLDEVQAIERLTLDSLVTTAPTPSPAEIIENQVPDRSQNTAPGPVDASARGRHDTGGRKSLGIMDLQDYPQQHDQTQQPILQESSSEQDMSFANIVSPQPDQHSFAPSSPVSTNPFRRSLSVSPRPSNSTPSTHNIDFRGEDPFSISATSSQGASPNPRSPNLATTPSATTPGLDSTTDVPPELFPPPAYVQVEGSSSTADILRAFDPLLPQSTITQSTITPAVETSVIVAPTNSTEPLGTTQVQPTSSWQSEDVNQYVLKPIDWIDPTTSTEKRIKIITQNGKIAITPYDRPAIAYDHLLEILADYLLNEDFTDPDPFSSSATQRIGQRVESEKIKTRLEIESALRLLPHLEHGLDVNVYFKSIRGFEPTAELGLFHTFGVELVHGWVVSPEADAAMFALVDGPAGITSYNKAVECIVSGDDAGGGLVVEDVRGNVAPIQLSSHHHALGSSSRASTQDEALQNEKITQALIVQEFMNITKTQLTHYGLHVLQESLPEGHLCAFFRNNHA
ncbi:hypothetical protein BGZ65_008486 [Modicella reniformis]|uniref:F-box domain-containing protein n=1 Tax=Modicella reniformis TaxID=1440133 RepID=A0A9P6IMY2_9FUNG|nr:hypothetical protein BGZ65_008486 [Modicella reniformis]